MMEAQSEIRPGHIVSITLKNFMCHSHLEVKFDKNIGFLIGRNGSGKSAIMTALIVGLGGKAANTNRSTSIKSFIKHDQTSATVEIILTNTGPQAYRQSDFGETIFVARTITQSGSSSYKLKSASGKVVSTYAKDIKHMCLKFNIQIDNPICLLTQDISRNFLHNSNPRQKFELFMRATRLEELNSHYQKAIENTNNALKILKDKEAARNRLKEMLDEIEIKIETRRKKTAIVKKEKALQLELLWSKVQVEEKKVQAESEKVTEAEKEKDRYSDLLKTNNQSIDASTELLLKLDDEIGVLHTQINDQNIPQNIIVKDLGELKEKYHEKKLLCRKIEKELVLITSHHDMEESSLKADTKQYENRELKRKNLESQLTTLANEIRDTENLIETTQNDRFQAFNSAERLRKEEQTLSEEMTQVTYNIKATTTKIEGIDANPKNILSLYGRNMPRLVELIKANKNFKDTPRGPLGSYIRVKKQEWAGAIEAFLKNHLLGGFIVSNNDDFTLLRKIMLEVYGGPNQIPVIILMKFEKKIYNVRKHLVQPPEGIDSLYSLLEFSDPNVANCLIDRTSLENVILVPTFDQALDLMSDETKVPKNCRQCITQEGHDIYPVPDYRVYFSQKDVKSQLLQGSIQEMKQQLKHKLTQQEDKKITVKKQYEVIQNEYRKENQYVREIDNKISKLQKDLLSLKESHKEVKRQFDLDNLEVNVMPADNCLIENLEKYKKTINEKNAEKQQVSEQIDELKRKLNKKEDKLNEIKKVVLEYELRMEDTRKRRSELESKKNEENIRKKFTLDRLKASENSLTLCKSQLLREEEVMRGLMETAKSSGERPQNIRTDGEILEEIDQIKRILRKIEASTEPLDQLIQMQSSHSENFTGVNLLIAQMNTDLSIMSDVCERRKDLYERTKNNFVSNMKKFFRHILQARNFKGDIDVNFPNKKLDLIVVPQEGTQGSSKTSNLSGGERSYTTVAFLYCLWKCMKFPFYFLDEFDVFMDKANRNKVIEILIGHAKDESDSQYIFLTPQDISFVNDPQVSVYELPNPERSFVQ